MSNFSWLLIVTPGPCPALASHHDQGIHEKMPADEQRQSPAPRHFGKDVTVFCLLPPFAAPLPDPVTCFRHLGFRPNG